MTRRRLQVLVASIGAVLLLAGALIWFQPWKLWVDTRVDEALPVTVAATAGSTTPPSSIIASPTIIASTSPDGRTSPPATPTGPTTAANTGPTTATPTTIAAAADAAPSSTEGPTSAGTTESSAPVGPVVLRTGSLISHEHETSGTVAIVQLPDGSRVLTLENLSTSDGPDVRVWLSSAPVIPGEAGWYTFADSPYVDLGALKGNLGNQVYEIPAEVDLAALPNVSLWCQRFSVSFGAAELQNA